MIQRRWLMLLMAGWCVGAGGCGSGSGTGGAADAAFQLTSITPNTAFTVGGSSLRVSGSGFLGIDALEVQIGGGSASAVTVVSDTLLTCDAPPGPSGPADVTMLSSGGRRTLEQAFMYYRSPVEVLESTRMVNDDARTTAVREPRVCCEGNRVHVLWRDDALGSYDVYARSSHDGGATWLRPGINIDAGRPGEATSTDLQVECSGDRVYAIWSTRVPGPRPNVYFARSLDAGLTWEAAQRINTTRAGEESAYDPHMCCDGDDVYVVWEDGRLDAAAIYLNHSADGGETWRDNDIRIDLKPRGANQSYEPQICCEGDHVYVVWMDERDGFGDVYFRRSTDRAHTWEPSRRLDTDDAGVNHSSRVRICCSDGNVHVVWSDPRNGLRDIYMNRSTDGGASWLIADTRVDTQDPGGQRDDRAPEICCSGERVYVCWRLWTATYSLGLRFSASHDAGESWVVEDRSLSTTGKQQRIRCDGPYVYVAYTDERDGETDVYLNHSTTAGLTFQTEDIRLDTDDAGSASSDSADLCVDGARLHAVWRDDSADPGNTTDVHYQRSIP